MYVIMLEEDYFFDGDKSIRPVLSCKSREEADYIVHKLNTTSDGDRFFIEVVNGMTKKEFDTHHAIIKTNLVISLKRKDHVFVINDDEEEKWTNQEYYYDIESIEEELEDNIEYEISPSRNHITVHLIVKGIEENEIENQLKTLKNLVSFIVKNLAQADVRSMHDYEDAIWNILNKNIGEPE